jgi:uncharacterized protein YbaR (Trm112 family)
MIDTKLLDILACPACKGDVNICSQRKNNCTDVKRNTRQDGIPVMLLRMRRIMLLVITSQIC